MALICGVGDCSATAAAATATEEENPSSGCYCEAGDGRTSLSAAGIVANNKDAARPLVVVVVVEVGIA